MGTRRGGAGCAVYDGRLYIAGGYNGMTTLSSVERYDSIANVWANDVAAMKSRRFSVCLTLTLSMHIL
jgi:hypothetical protein